MRVSSWLLEARTSETENQEAQRRVRGARSRLRGDNALEPLIQPTSVPLSHGRRGWAVSLHRVGGLRKPSGELLRLCLWGIHNAHHKVGQSGRLLYNGVLSKKCTLLCSFHILH